MGITSSDSSNETIEGQYAYHILRVQQNSPAQFVGLQPFFDFILTINGCKVSPERPHQLHRELTRCLGRSVDLAVYSSRLRSVRHLTLYPSDNWGGQGLLGASARLCTNAGEAVFAWRVLDIQPGSPADMAGLRAGTDYVVGADTPLHSPEDLFDLIESRHRCHLRLYVYCCLGDHCREVTVTPCPGWGGDGALGCGIGYGYLHQIPCGGGIGDDSNDDDDSNMMSKSGIQLPQDLPSAHESTVDSVHNFAEPVATV